MKKYIAILCLALSWQEVSSASDYTTVHEIQRFDYTDLLSVRYGTALAVDGERMLVSGLSSLLDTGVQVLERNHGGIDAWGTVALLHDPEPGELFGSSVALSGDWAAVAENNHGGDRGAVYLYYRNSGGVENSWGLAKVIDNPFYATNRYATSVSIDDDVLAVGSSLSGHGAVAVYHRHAGGTDNWGFVKQLATTGDMTLSQFGLAVGVDCNRIVVGAPFYDLSPNEFGRAYVYERNSGGLDNWGLVTILEGSDQVDGDRFGISVAIHADTIVVGTETGDGKAFVFKRNEGGADQWGEVAKLVPDDGYTGDDFGRDVDLFNDYVLIGARESSNAVGNVGAAYLFGRNEGGAENWGQVKKITAVGGEVGDDFGDAVGMSASALAVGDPSCDDKGYQAGAVYIYPNACYNFTETAAETAPALQTNAYFGRSVDLFKDIAIVGEPDHKSGGYTNGRAYVLYRNKGGPDNWGIVVTITPEAGLGSATQDFGQAVAMWDDTAIIGAEIDVDGKIGSGAAFIYQRNQGGGDDWEEVTPLIPDELGPDQAAGQSVAIHRDTAVVGAHLTDANSLLNSGMAFIYERDEDGIDVWGQVTALSASDGQSLDFFGRAVAVWGDLIAAGAPGHNPTGSHPDAGAVYIFHRNEGGLNYWGEVAKISASDVTANDFFGRAVAFYGNTLVVGAPGWTGTNDTAYVFEMGAGPDDWTQTAVLTLSDPVVANTYFGQSVDVWEDIILIGRRSSVTPGYVYARNEGGADNWGLVGNLMPNNVSAATRSGYGVAIHGRTAIVGDAAYIGPGGASLAGRVHIGVPDCIEVTTYSDAVAAGGETSLREAITMANTNLHDDCILLPPGTFPMSLGPAGDDLNASGDYDILDTAGHVTIKGAGAMQTFIDGGGLDRVFEVHPGARVQFEELSVKNGMSQSGGTGGEPGGGIYNRSTTTLHRVMVVSNMTADGVGLTSGGSGGGIASTESLVIHDSTVAFNRTGNGQDIGSGIFAGDGGRGGGIFAQGSLLHIRNSTVSHNETGNGGSYPGGTAGDGGRGGGIYGDSSTAVVEHASIAFNVTGSGGSGGPSGIGGHGGGVFANDKVILYHTIVSDNKVGGGANGPAGSGSFVSMGYNIVDSTNEFSFIGDITGNQVIDPDLQELGDNGGPTWTHGLENGSPAIDSGDPLFVFVGLGDQRGVLREPNAVIDIGAVEVTDDFDSDTIPDDWEIANGMDYENPGDSVIDADFDTFDGIGEYISDTDPFDGDDAHRITEVFSIGFNFFFLSPTSTNRMYQAQMSIDNGASWLNLGSPYPGTGTNAGLATSTTFYSNRLLRIKALLP